MKHFLQKCMRYMHASVYSLKVAKNHGFNHVAYIGLYFVRVHITFLFN